MIEWWTTATVIVFVLHVTDKILGELLADMDEDQLNQLRWWLNRGLL
jgi:hypothetical protein